MSARAPARRYPWRTFAFLAAAGTLTAPLAIPYTLALEANVRAAAPPPNAFGVLAMMARALVLMTPAAGLGLLVARRLGLGAPYLESWLDGAPRPAEPLRSIAGPALRWAAVAALAAFGVDAFFVRALGVRVPAPEIHARIDVVWWRGALASLWAPFAEETFDRLLLLSLVAWIGTSLFRARGSRGRTVALWCAILLTATFFGWYHIGNERIFAQVVPPIVALRTVLIILPVGLAFGWLYVRRGLEAAILSHFLIDLIVHVLRPLAGRLG
ncbi:MAG TPA: CPBP family intramembrane glutamic endopeptidase [Terriglobales bacterium]|nr:CPBP family intramembrane glutamic endopeptidase [Terriglobales bacterium]